MKEIFAAYIWSDDWWTFSQDAWNATDKFYTNSRVINEDSLNWQDFIDGEAYHASVYFELNKTDAHGFTPTSIKLKDDGSVEVDGTGGDGNFEDFRGPYEIGTTEFYGADGELFGMTPVEFMVSNIITADTEEEKAGIISFIEAQQEIDTDFANEATGNMVVAAETFNAKSKKRRSSRKTRGPRKGQKALMQRKSKLGKGISSYSNHGHAENFTTSKYAESFASESASDSIAAESSKAVEGINPTAVNDGTWLAETINSRNAESKHDYAHRVIEGNDYVHYNGKGNQTRRTNRGKSISADRRKYSPNRNLKPGQGHMGDFVREAQGYDDRLNESMGERNTTPRTGEMTMGDRRNMSKGMEKSRNRRPYSGDTRMDRRQRRARAESSFNKRAESPMTSPETYKPTAYSPTSENPANAAPSSMGTGDQIISVSSPSAPPNDIKFAETVQRGLHKCVKCQHWNRNIRKGYSKCKKCGHGKFKRVKGTTKRSEFGVVGQGPNFGQDLDAESICSKHAETFEACGCEKEEKRAEPSGSQPTNQMASGDNPLMADAVTQPGSELVNVDSPSAPPSNIFEQSAEGCSCQEGMCMCAETKQAEMNYDGSLYGDQYFPDAITANQVNVGKLGSTPSADGSGQGVLGPWHAAYW